MTGNKSKITMSGLAEMAGVDVSTVSRALNDSPVVKPETKELIARIAEETGYAVNASARSLRRQSSDALGLVIPMKPGSGQTISDPFFLEMVGAVSHAASQRGYDLVVSVPQSEEKIADKRLLQTGRADGLIIIGQAGREERLNALGPLTKKVIVWGGDVGNTNYALVGSDNVGGGKKAARHLLELGRRTILFIGDTSLPEANLRYEGFCQAHDELGYSYDPDLKLEEGFGGGTAFAAVQNLIDVGTKFDAVFAASDVLAMAAIHALNSRGVGVPDDVAVVGYDDIGQAALNTPALTTIKQNIALGGELLVDLLVRMIAGETVQSQLTPTELIVRASCGCKTL